MDVSGIPNMGFGGSPAPFGPGGSFGSWSANDINRSMGLGPGGIGDQNQAGLNNIFNNFGKQTDYYSNLGASYGRQTGGFGGYGGNNDPFSPVGGGYPAGQVERQPLPDIPWQDPFGGGSKGGSSKQGPAFPAGDVSRGPDLAPPAQPPAQGPAFPAGGVSRGPDLAPPQQPAWTNPWATSGGKDPFAFPGDPDPNMSPPSNGPALPQNPFFPTFSGQNRNTLAKAIMDGISPQAPPIQAPQAPGSFDPIQSGGGLNRPWGFTGQTSPGSPYFTTGPEGAGVGGWGTSGPYGSKGL